MRRVHLGIGPAALVLVGSVAVVAAGAQAPARWSVDATPTLVLGASQSDTSDMFAEVRGATRLPNGQILVGDEGGFALRLFSPEGKPIRQFGRRGHGPGEIVHLKRLLRCGDALVTLDGDAQRTSVFTLGGAFVRSFRFSAPDAGQAPFASTCNASGDFAHYGWEIYLESKPGIFRPNVPFWLSRSDSAVRRIIGLFPGSERFGFAVNGRMAQTRPLPLGKKTAIAVGADRVYVATGDRFEILLFGLDGAPLPSIRESRSPVAITKADVAEAKALELALVPEPRREAMSRGFDELTFPPTLPTYSALVVDSDGNLWAQDYPRASLPTSRWTVFDAAGRPAAAVELPRYLEIYEIGRDYVLGRYLDPEEAVPQVRSYRLQR